MPAACLPMQYKARSDAFTRPSCDNAALLLLEKTTPATWTQSAFRWLGPRHEPLSSLRILTSCRIEVDMHASANRWSAGG
jgi:hypothetical protein